LVDWLCDSLGLPLLEEISLGVLHLNAAARELLGLGSTRYASSISDALAPLITQLSKPGNLLASLHAALQNARQGNRSELNLAENLRALIFPVKSGRAAVVLAPRGAFGSRNSALESLNGSNGKDAREAKEAKEPGAERSVRSASSDRSARATHELANALGAIAGWAQLARGGARVDEALELIERSAQDAFSAARGALSEVRRGPTSAATSTREPLDLSSFTADAVRLLWPKALKKRATLRTAVQPNLHIQGDRGDISTVVWNLAGNAIEAVPEGGAVCVQLTESSGRARLCVSDDGPGMSAEVRARVFEPYFTTKPSGAGLGLALVKQAVHALNGTIDLESELDRGTRFYVEFPLALSQVVNRDAPSRHTHRHARHESGVYVADLIGSRIVVVDDDPSLREMIGTALQMRGASVELAADVHAALSLSQEGGFQLAVVDYLLGDQRGDAALSLLRKAGVIQTGLIITGTDLPRKLAPGGEPDSVLRKPFELDELFERVSALLGRVSAASNGRSTVEHAQT